MHRTGRKDNNCWFVVPQPKSKFNKQIHRNFQFLDSPACAMTVPHALVCKARWNTSKAIMSLMKRFKGQDCNSDSQVMTNTTLANVFL